MIIIDTPFHISFSDNNEKPFYACTEKCKTIWYLSDADKDLMICKKCGGKLEKAIEKIHYKVLRKHNKRLSLNDFKKHLSNLSRKDKELIKSYTEGTAKVGLLSIVKPQFIDKAEKEWS
ncbi:MAG: hypothetical protein GQ532_19135 [Methylomarinum sp.]|nr:hypothetical protein [Methylomarinum sp.]